MYELINAKKRLAFSKIFLDGRYPEDNDVILRIIDFFNLIKSVRVRIYDIGNNLLSNMCIQNNKTVKDLKEKLSMLMKGNPYRMLYKIDRGNGEFEARRDNHYPDDELLTNTTGLKIIDLIVIPLATVKHQGGGSKRNNRKSKRSRRKSRRYKRRSKRCSKKRCSKRRSKRRSKKR